MLGDRLDICRFTAPVAKGTPESMDHLADIALFDEDAWPHRRQDRFLRDERAAVSDEMDECLERLFGMTMRCDPRRRSSVRSPTLSMKLAELVHLEGRSGTAESAE